MLLLLLRLQVTQQIFDLVLALHRGEAFLQLGLAQVGARLGGEQCLLCAAGGGRLIDASTHARDGA